MQLSKLILNNSILYPPAFDDWQPWLNFRRFLNATFRLKDAVTHPVFAWVVNIYILLCCINAIVLLSTGLHILRVIDSVFVWLFFAEIVLRVLAVGPENFFSDRWNGVEAFLVLLNVVFFFVSVGNNIDNLFRLNRIWRVAGVVRAVL